ncbi:MAG: SusF/SusE family outer membrane protein [Paludibacter sp.]|nr:SusF/SusE family outer membrane protein [Paludibacter sp.]
MKNMIKNILIILTILMVSCQEISDMYTLKSPEDTMHLSVSAADILLNQDLKNQVAVTFTWNTAADRGSGTELTYYFKMDITGNNFETSIDKIEIPEGQNSISFTNKEMNDLLAGWDIEAGQTVQLTAEIIAEASNSTVYMKPEISTADLNVTGYYIQPRDLYIVGSAVDGMDPAKSLKMEEVTSEKKYTWAGVLQPGDFKFIKDTTNLYPSYSLGIGSNILVYNETENSSETLFHIDNAGFYVITIDIEALTFESEYPTAAYSQVWMIGDATSAGWNISNPVELQKDPVNQVAFIYEGTLNAGEFKFPLQNIGLFECDYFMPVENQASPDGDNRVEYVSTSQAATHDYKWRIYDAGTYKITLNVYDMTISFQKQAEPEIPNDLPYKNVWITGSATPGSWDTPFSQKLTYDANTTKGTFIWEGNLSEGEFKFPLSNTNGFECNYLMPTNVGSNNLAPLSQTAVSFVANGSPDKKWTVSASESGSYKISLNVINMTVSFVKQ